MVATTGKRQQKVPSELLHADLLNPLIMSLLPDNCFEGWRESKISSEVSTEHLENSLRIAAAAIEPDWHTGFTNTRSNIPLDFMALLLSFQCVLTKQTIKQTKKPLKIKIRSVTFYYIFNEGCSECNASYFMMLAHDIIWYGSRSWTFPLIFRYILLLCDRWQQRGSLTEWHLTWKCMWNKGVSLNPSMWKKMHLLSFSTTYWTFVETKQWIAALWGIGWCFSAVITATVVTSAGFL